jgi:hypothetical protein
MKKPTYLTLIRMFFDNMREPGIINSLQNKAIEFNCVILANILDISNEGPHVFEKKIIPTIKGFVYDIMHIGRHDSHWVYKLKVKT